MPLTPFQRKILLLLAANRNPESYVAGATVVNKSPGSARFSRDIDLFHDPAASLIQCAGIDIKTLRDHGLNVELGLETASFVRATVKDDMDGVKLEWATDTAFRFFPVIADPDLGYSLHPVDVAVNKCLALAGRTEIRDVIDVLTINDELIHLGVCCWAACGKDPGFTPDLILEMISRNARITPDLLSQEMLRAPIDPKVVKKKWLKILKEARVMVNKLNPNELGCLYINKKGEVSRLPAKGDKPHFGSVRGTWPVVAN